MRLGFLGGRLGAMIAHVPNECLSSRVSDGCTLQLSKYQRSFFFFDQGVM